MKLSFALAAALFLPVLVNAQSDAPSTNRAPTQTAPASPAAPASPTAPARTTPTVVASPAAPTVPESATATKPVSSASPSVPTSTSTKSPISSVSSSVSRSDTTMSPVSSASSSVPASSTTTSPANFTSSYVSTNATTTGSTSSISAVVNINNTATGSVESNSSTATRSGSSTRSAASAKTTTTTKGASSPSPKGPPRPTATKGATTTSPKGPPNTTTTKAGGPPPPPAPAPTPTCPPTDTCVQVAPDNQNTYDPSNFGASNGTVVTFIFLPDSDLNSVTQGKFDDPCVYLTATGGTSSGFDSGLQNGKLFSIRITNDQQPIWFFSKTGKVCGQGMVGAINPPPVGGTYNAYLDAAKALGPNQNTLSDSGPVLDGVGAEPEGTPSPIPSPPTSSSSHLVPDGFFALLAAVFGITLA